MIVQPPSPFSGSCREWGFSRQGQEACTAGLSCYGVALSLTDPSLSGSSLPNKVI